MRARKAEEQSMRRSGSLKKQDAFKKHEGPSKGSEWKWDGKGT